jgi:hypothetical protein
MVRAFGRVVLVWGLAMAAGRPAGAQPVPEQEVAAAIRAGRAGKVDSLRASCTAGPAKTDPPAPVADKIARDGTYAVSLSGSAGRIAVLAADAKRRGEPYGVEDVPRELREAGVYLFVNPIRPTLAGGAVSAPSPIDKVAIRALAQPEPSVAPDGVDWEGVEWRNPLGGFIEANRATASFPWAAIRDLPPGDLEVVITAEAGERRCTIPAPVRRRVVPPR